MTTPSSASPLRSAKEMKQRAIIVILALVIFSIISSIFPFYTLKAYHSDTTASHKSWTQWPFGIKTNYTYGESAFEAFLKENIDEPIDYQWVSSRGTKKNIYGAVLVRAHGRPNGLLGYQNEFLDIWIDHTQEDQIISFYETLKNGTTEDVELAISGFFEQSNLLINKHWQNQPE